MARCNINNILGATCAAAPWNHANLKDKVINCSYKVLGWERGHAERLVCPFQIISLFSIINEKLPAGLKWSRCFPLGEGSLEKDEDMAL